MIYIAEDETIRVWRLGDLIRSQKRKVVTARAVQFEEEEG